MRSGFLRIAGSTLTALFAVAGVSLAGVGDGPRAYQLAPVGTNILILNTMVQDSSFNLDGSPAIPAARVDADVFALQYTRVVEIGGNAAGLFAVLPVGRVKGSLTGTSMQGTSSGFADAQIGAVIGLIGSPAMSAQKYAAFKPGFALGLLGKLAVPIGNYDSSKTVNLGTNRWAAQIGVLASWQIGESFLPGNVTLFELTPSVWFYGDNTDLSGAGVRLEQDPLFNLEAHLIHDFSNRYWGSIDGVYTIGGATTTDGVPDNIRGEALGVGFTFGVYLPRNIGLQFSYGQTIKNNTDGFDDRLLRVKLAKIF